MYKSPIKFTVAPPMEITSMDIEPMGIDELAADIAKEFDSRVEKDILMAARGCHIDVDRDELIKALNYDRDQYDKGYADGKADAEQRWIQCAERMPEEREWLGTKRFGTTISDEVYVTFENPKGERFCRHLSFQNGKLSAFDQSTIDAFFKGSRPVAWKPLPDPCRD